MAAEATAARGGGAGGDVQESREDGEGGSAADVVRLYGPEEIREELAISHSSGVWLRCLAFDADLWFSCLHRRREEGTTHSPELDALLDSLRVTTHT